MAYPYRYQTARCSWPAIETSEIVGTCSLKLRMGSQKHGRLTQHMQVFVMPNLMPDIDLILGESWMHHQQVELSYKKMHVIINSRIGPVYLKPRYTPDQDRAVEASEPIHPEHALTHQIKTPLRPALTVKQAKRLLRRGARPFLFSIKQVDDSHPDAFGEAYDGRCSQRVVASVQLSMPSTQMSILAPDHTTHLDTQPMLSIRQMDGEARQI